jgi:branched-chain amino acid transport system permease protein
VSLPILGSGIVDGFVLALVAVGFTVIYNATRVLNFANGEFMMGGAYVAWYTWVQHHWPFPLALLAGAATGAALGIISDRIFVGPVRRATLFTQVTVLYAFASILDGSYQIIFGATQQSVPAYVPDRGFVPGFRWSWLDITIMGASAVIIVALVLFLFRTRWGGQIRAVADNPTGAGLVGINPNAVALVAWTVGGLITALGGILIIPLLDLNISVGSQLTFSAFAAVVLGGFGSLTGALVGGLIIGVAQVEVAALWTAGLEPLVSLALMLIVLTVWPNGLMGSRA